MKTIEIKDRYNNEIIHSAENLTIKDVVIDAVKNKISLSGADLSGADLRDAIIPLFCKWNVSICNNEIKIGCKTKTIEEWDMFFASNEEYSTPRNTKEFNLIYAYYQGAKAYITELNK